MMGDVIRKLEKREFPLAGEIRVHYRCQNADAETERIFGL